MAPLSLAGETIWEMRKSLPSLPSGEKLPSPLHILYKFSDTQPPYMQLCGELTTFLPPPTPRGARAGKGASENL